MLQVDPNCGYCRQKVIFLTQWKIWGYMGAFCEKYAVIFKISTYFVLKPQYFHKIEFMWPIDAIWWKTTIYRYNKTKIYLLNVWKMWLHPAISTWGVFGFLYKNVNQSLFLNIILLNNAHQGLYFLTVWKIWGYMGTSYISYISVSWFSINICYICMILSCNHIFITFLYCSDLLWCIRYLIQSKWSLIIYNWSIDWLLLMVFCDIIFS